MSWLAVLARLVLGLTFLWMAVAKLGDPVVFLKLLREYGMLPERPPWILNTTAVVLPWLELFGGLLVLLGIAVRGAALMLALMLAVFSGAVLLRALGIADAEQIALCAVRFDCGCGAGPQPICGKLLENAGLLLASVIVLLAGHGRLALRPQLFGER